MTGFHQVPTQENASNCNQCLQPVSGNQSTYQGSYKQHRNQHLLITSLLTLQKCERVFKFIGCSDYKIEAISRKTKVPKNGLNIVVKNVLGLGVPLAVKLEGAQFKKIIIKLMDIKHLGTFKCLISVES